ncbi:unnamed protein product [Allacma fusca]|uniref:Uncharacterized protein n=1 Tax=Allacma fusca TaxID=39272 RepID=A0A8J2LCD2_9HEXA|nr:unnamed protein product [Allacma fusca]
MGTPTSLIRLTSFTKTAVYEFFHQLEDLVTVNGFTAAGLFNCNETGVSLVPVPSFFKTSVNFPAMIIFLCNVSSH